MSVNPYSKFLCESNCFCDFFLSFLLSSQQGSASARLLGMKIYLIDSASSTDLSWESWVFPCFLVSSGSWENPPVSPRTHLPWLIRSCSGSLQGTSPVLENIRPRPCLRCRWKPLSSLQYPSLWAQCIWELLSYAVLQSYMQWCWNGVCVFVSHFIYGSRVVFERRKE